MWQRNLMIEILLMLITVERRPARCSDKTCGLSPLPLAPPFLKCGGELMAFCSDLQPRPSTRRARLTAGRKYNLVRLFALRAPEDR